MAQINPNIPIIGDPVATEEPKVKTALEDIVDEINGKLDNSNIASGANINGSKLLNSSIETGKLADNAVTSAKIDNGAVTEAKLASNAVTSAKIADGTIATADLANGSVTADKIAASTTATATNSSGVTGTITARKYADGLVILSGSYGKSGTGAVATLPVGFRPVTQTFHPIGAVANLASTLGFMTVQTDGLLILNTGGLTGGWVDSISFHAA